MTSERHASATRRLLLFLGLLAPYAVFAAASVVVGAAFVAPNAVFGTIEGPDCSSR